VFNLLFFDELLKYLGLVDFFFVYYQYPWEVSVHRTSKQNMKKCYDKYFCGSFLDNKNYISVLDIGSIDINGSYREIFNNIKIKYVGADLEGGNGVDVVLKDPYHYPFDSESMDVVLSGQTFEHCEFFWQSFVEMCRVLKKDGYLFLICPSAGRVHRYPVDCYRFYPDSYAALAKYAHVTLVEKWIDERSEWKDFVGVFQK
jgi:SAM-dependent methyltransferase